jgi:hypothetical protein
MVEKKQTNWVDEHRGLVVICVIGIILFFVAISTIQQSGDKTITFTPSDGYALAILNARLASTSNYLDGSGKFTEETCNKLGDLAKKFNSSADYIKCDSPSSIYLGTPDSSGKNILTLSDENYTATFTTDKDTNKLIDYTFLNKPSGGFNKSGGRK